MRAQRASKPSRRARSVAARAHQVSRPSPSGSGTSTTKPGRADRFFTEAQRTAAALRHQTCAAHGCQIPYAWCEAHHRVPWHQGGRTDLRDLVPLCGYHHQRIHDPEFDHRYRPDGALSFVRRT